MFLVKSYDLSSMKEGLNKIETFYNSHQLEEAIVLIDELLQVNDENEELYFWKGKVHYKRQEWGKAINSFNKVMEINPNNRDAQSQIDMAKSILGFFTPDMFNP